MIRPARALAQAHSNERSVFDRFGSAAMRTLSAVGDDGCTGGEEGMWSHMFSGFSGEKYLLDVLTRRGVRGDRTGDSGRVYEGRS